MSSGAKKAVVHCTPLQNRILVDVCDLNHFEKYIMRNISHYEKFIQSFVSDICPWIGLAFKSDIVKSRKINMFKTYKNFRLGYSGCKIQKTVKPVAKKATVYCTPLQKRIVVNMCDKSYFSALFFLSDCIPNIRRTIDPFARTIET